MNASRCRPPRWILAVTLALAVAAGGLSGGAAAAGGWADDRRMMAAVLFAVGAMLAGVGAALSWQTTATTGASGAGALGAVTMSTGAELFHAKGCATCHTGPDTTATMGAFPSLATASSWAGERRAGMSAEAYIAESIRSPGAFRSPGFVGGGPTDGMPDLGLTDEEIAALVEYLLQG
jgi:mono/diheme cytochrome c family protein